MNINFPAKFLLVLEFSSAEPNTNDENRKAAADLFNTNGLSSIFEKTVIITPEKAFKLPEMPFEKVFIPGTRPLKNIIRDLSRKNEEAALHLEYAGEDSRRLTSYLVQLISLYKKAKTQPVFMRLSETVPTSSGYNTPAHRAVEIRKDHIQALGRSLNANMTGQITLNGTSLDLHFNQGSLKKISRNQQPLFSSLNSRTRFVTSGGTLNYRNESAFSFEDDSEYGLRTLQIPKLRKKRSFRVITDFLFGEKHEEALITVTVDYPIFGEGLIINESAVFETPLLEVPENGLKIESDTRKVQPVHIQSTDEKKMFIPGKTFRIKSGNRILTLSFPEKLKNHQISPIDGLSAKTVLKNEKAVLFINPGGSYTPAPAEHYNGVKEQFCFTLGIEEKIEKLPETRTASGHMNEN